MSPDQIDIRVDQDIYEYLKERSTFEDTPSNVLRRELKLPVPMREAATASAASTASTPAAFHETDDIPAPARRASRGPAKPRTTKGTRAAAGTLLPEGEYFRPLLEILAAAGGSAPKPHVIQELGERLDERLTEADREALTSGGIRWESRAQFARMRLADRGFIDKSASRGVWAITPEGTTALEDGTI